jgi:hypothetical protein
MDCISGERYLSFVMVFGNLIFDKAHVRAEIARFDACLGEKEVWRGDERGVLE